jgi:hypothetical protein
MGPNGLAWGHRSGQCTRMSLHRPTLSFGIWLGGSVARHCVFRVQSVSQVSVLSLEKICKNLETHAQRKLGSRNKVWLICSLSDMMRNTYNVVTVYDVVYDITYCISYTISYAYMMSYTMCNIQYSIQCSIQYCMQYPLLPPLRFIQPVLLYRPCTSASGIQLPWCSRECGIVLSLFLWRKHRISGSAERDPAKNVFHGADIKCWTLGGSPLVQHGNTILLHAAVWSKRDWFKCAEEHQRNLPVGVQILRLASGAQAAQEDSE